MTCDYESFLGRKAMVDPPTGLREVPPLPPHLFDFQRDIVQWACRRGRAAIFAGTGLGKSLMELAWARAVNQSTGCDVLIVTPLAVAAQMVREGSKFGIDARHVHDESDVAPGISVVNYQRLHRLDLDRYSGVVLDESSILKAVDGKTRTMLVESFRHVPFRLAATATPAPNDYMELGNHAEFLGVMSHTEMLSTFFVHDGGETQKWRLKGHAQADFWRWMCSWSVMLTHPRDLGYPGDQYDLPPLNQQSHVVRSSTPAATGMLFALEAQTLQERIVARRATVEDRVKEAARIVAQKPDESWIVWCNLNDESSMLAKSIPGAVEVKGSDSDDQKESSMIGFADGNIRVLVTKPSIAGFGMNWQHCANMIFVGLNDSWEQIYQATRRCWRFGQTRQVNVHFVAADIEGAVLANLERKEKQARAMVAQMIAHTAELTATTIRGSARTKDDYSPAIKMEVPQWLKS